MSKVKLSFCRSCSALLWLNLGDGDPPECGNCGADTEKESARIEGEFELADAKRMLELNFGDEDAWELNSAG